MAYTRRNVPLSDSKYPLKAKYGNYKKTHFVIHNTFNDASAINEANNLNRSDNYGDNSFNYVMDDKELISCVPEKDYTHHSASSHGNAYGIGLEICYSASGGARYAKAEENAIDFVARELINRGWNVNDHVIYHRYYANTSCPNRIPQSLETNFRNRLAARMKEINGGSKPVEPAKPSGTKYINLHPMASYPNYGVYRMNDAPVAANIFDHLTPNFYGGLSYEILEFKNADVVVINTGAFGKVKVYVDSTRASITAKPLYTGSEAPAPVKPTKRYINIKPMSDFPRYGFYLPNAVPVAANIHSYLEPYKLGGLSYEVKGSAGNDVYFIQSRDFGKIKVFLDTRRAYISDTPAFKVYG